MASAIRAQCCSAARSDVEETMMFASRPKGGYANSCLSELSDSMKVSLSWVATARRAGWSGQ